MKITLRFFLFSLVLCIPSAFAQLCIGCDSNDSCYQCHSGEWQSGYRGSSAFDCTPCADGQITIKQRIPRAYNDPRAVHGISGRGQDLIATAEGYIRGLMPAFTVKPSSMLTLEQITRFGKSPEHAAILAAARAQSRAVCSARIPEYIRILKRDRL